MGTRTVRRPVGRLLMIAGAALGLSACSVNPTTPMSYVVDGFMMLDSGKGMSDHALSTVLGRDCAMFRVLRGDSICQDVHADAPVPEGMELITTSRRPIYVAANEPTGGESIQGSRPYLTDTMIFRAAPIQTAEGTQALVVAHASTAAPSGTVVAVAPSPVQAPTPTAVASLPSAPPPIEAVSAIRPAPLQNSLAIGSVTVETLEPIGTSTPPSAVVAPSVAAVPVALPAPAPVIRPAPLQDSLAIGAVAVEALEPALDAPSPSPSFQTVATAVPTRSLDAPLPPRRDGPAIEVAALEPPLPPRRPVHAILPVLRLASAVPLNLAAGEPLTVELPSIAADEVPLSVAEAPVVSGPTVGITVAGLGSVPAPPRRPGWFLEPAIGAEVAAVPLLAPAVISTAPIIQQVADLPLQ